MAPVYDKLQQVFCLNQIANSASGTPGTAQQLQGIASSKIQAVLADRRVRKLIGTWEVVWGPVVWQHHHGHVADNTMYVARNTDTSGGNDEYVVAVAGTNPISWFGWLVEDFEVATTVAWPFNRDTGDLQPRISKGTATGLDVLLEQMVFDQPGVGPQTLTQYLQTLTGVAVDVTVTGHSLGGALSAATALALADMQGQADLWDPGRNAVVAAVPSAGPTPGTADFAQYYTQRIGTRTHRIWNVLDIVPHAWQADLLVQAPHLYFPYLVPNALIHLVVDLALADSKAGGDYVQINEQTPGLPSQVYLDKIYTAESPLTGLEIELAVFKAAVNALIAVVGKRQGWPKWKIEAAQEIVDWLLAHWLERKVRHGGFSVGELAGPLAELSIPEVSTSDLIELATEIDVLLDFLVQAAVQHVVAYPGLLGVNDFKQLTLIIEG